MSDALRVPVELRAADDGGSSPGRISGVLIQTGRVAADRREVFTPGSVQWPSGGVRLLLEHRGREVMTFEPTVDGSEVRIDAELPDTDAGREAAAMVRTGQKAALSVEFRAMADATVSGVREVRSALVEAAALCGAGVYRQARAEVRERRPRYWL